MEKVGSKTEAIVTLEKSLWTQGRSICYVELGDQYNEESGTFTSVPLRVSTSVL